MAKRKGKGKAKKWIIIGAIALLIIGAVAAFFIFRREMPVMNLQYTTAKVERRTITSSLSGSGALQPANSYTVTTLMQGEILTAAFEEGDIVEKDMVLYEIDRSDVSNKIEMSHIETNQAQRNYDDAIRRQYIKAPAAGKVVEINVEIGDYIEAKQVVAIIRDSDSMNLVVPFPADDAKKFTVGQAAIVTLDNTFETLNGTIKSISATDSVGVGNMIIRNVEISVSNPGGLGVSQVATASVNGISCAAPGNFQYNTESAVIASNGGKVKSFNVKEGDRVSK